MVTSDRTTERMAASASIGFDLTDSGELLESTMKVTRVTPVMNVFGIVSATIANISSGNEDSANGINSNPWRFLERLPKCSTSDLYISSKRRG